MLIPVEWLKDFVETPDDPAELADRLTLTGNEIEEIRESEDGPVFYLKLTPNRADMLALEGAGREIAALYERPFKAVQPSLQATGPAESGVRVDVEAPDLCPRYVARVIRGVKIGPSPEWMRKRLEAAGVRSINNVVDVTNYVMLELGQPLHAFDLKKLAESRIIVRRARAGEPIVAIDGTEVSLQPDMLVIADGERPVAIAGVMGGQESEVSDDTTDILLESAYFHPTSVRRTAKRTGVSSASSYRFERGVDPNGVLRASDRAAQLLAELAGGTVSETVIDVYPTPIEPKRMPMRPERCRSLLGLTISDAEIQGYLERLGLAVEQETAQQWYVTAPTYRPDLAIEEDAIEEVGRMYGYDRLPETLPASSSGAGKLSPLEELVRSVRGLLTGQGLNEVVTNTLLARTFIEATGLSVSPVWPGEGGKAASLRNPLSEEFDTLRPSLLPGLLMAAQHNLRHGTRDINLFESGYGTTRIAEGAPQHRMLISGLLLGSRWSDVWNPDKQGAADFFSAKGTVEALCRGLGVPTLDAERVEHPSFHPGRSAWLSIAGERVGIVGELHPTTAAGLDLPRGVFVFELDGQRLLELRNQEWRYEAPSRFPRALRDLAVVVDDTVPSGGIEQVLRECVGEWGRSVRLFDVYTGKPLPEGKVSLAYALELGADDRTLQDDEVESRLSTARERLKTEYGAEFRG
jgi:phenylalanyl-tRNA synthetase beta chain